MEAYFQKVDSLMTILASLGSPVSDDDVVHYVLVGLPEKYNQVCGYMHYKDTFPDLKTVRSLLITEEMRLKSKSLALPVDSSSSSPLVLIAKSGTSHRSSNLQVKSWRPCFNFAKGSCRFGSECRYMQDSNAKTSAINPMKPPSTLTDDLLAKLLEKLGLNECGTNRGNTTASNNTMNNPPNFPVAYIVTPNPTTMQYPLPTPAQPNSYLIPTLAQFITPSPGFTYQPVHHQSAQTQQALQAIPTLLVQQPLQPGLPAPPNGFQVVSLAQQAQQAPLGFVTCTMANSGHTTALPQAYTIGTLHEPTTGTWNMDTGSEVLRRLVSFDFISCNKEKPPVLCHACQLGKHVRLPFVGFDTVVTISDPILPPNPNPSSIHHMVTRFRVGTNRPPERLTLHVSSVSSVSESYRDAFNDPNWQNAMCDEYNALIKNNTWTLVPRPTNTNIVRCMWLFRHKFHADGTLSRYKARLVANGSTQLASVDVDENFSPVVKPGTIRTVLSLATSRHWPVHQLDVKNAFLHGDLSETVYMHKPLGFRDSVHPDYGIDIGYLLLYIDDIVLTASSETLWQQVIGWLHQEFSMTDLGSLNYFLGISVTRDSSGLFLSQKKYATGCGSFSCLYKHDPRKPHLSALKRISQYVRGTLDYGLQLFSSSTTDLVASSDADWAGCLTTRHSTSGYCVFLGNNLLSWFAKRQPTLSRSSAEAEYRCVANAVAETFAAGQVRVLHVPSRYQFADIFIKGLPSVLFEEFRSSLSIRCPPAPTAGEC
nr:ribonuclease H-like domain-containing protein [Tanacetum cinerariifolium]